MLKDRIREARVSAELDYKTLADACEIGENTLRDYEKGKSEPKATTICNIAEICNVSEWWLLTGKGKMRAKDQDVAAIDKHLLSMPLIAHVAQAGKGGEMEGVSQFEVVETMTISASLLKTKPSGAVRIIKVDGYSMVPMLYPDTFVIFDEGIEFVVDGLYIINYQNQLMVKLLQVDPKGTLHIKSVNPQYESWKVSKNDQSYFKIIGRVLRVII